MNYIVIDRLSRNVLGEFGNAAQAQAFFLELVAAHPSAAPDLKILSRSGDAHEVPEGEVREAAGRSASAARPTAAV